MIIEQESKGVTIERDYSDGGLRSESRNFFGGFDKYKKIKRQVIELDGRVFGVCSHRMFAFHGILTR